MTSVMLDIVNRFDECEIWVDRVAIKGRGYEGEIGSKVAPHEHKACGGILRDVR